MSGPVLILTGPPGSGKTTVARTLAARRDQAAHVESDEFFRFVRAGFVAPWLPRAHRQNEVVMRAVAESAAAYAQGGYFTIVDGIISPRWFFAPLRDAMSARGIEVAYTILRPSAATAIARASSRAAGELADAAVIAQLYGDFTGIGALEAHVIDNDELSVEETADAVDAKLTRGELAV